MAESNARVQHFPSVDHVLALMEQGVSPPIFPPDVRFEYQWLAGGTLAPSITSSFSSPYLYRGQVERHRPCVPGVFRGFPMVRDPSALNEADWFRCLLNRVRLEEFLSALTKRPACDFAREIGLRMFPYSIAQHYEMVTDRIDLTQSHRIAAFFATNTREGGGWCPMVRGVGVMYRIHAWQFLHHLPEHLECVGRQALPRPGEQKAWTLRLPLGRDFESYPIEIFTFDHDESSGKRINDAFGGGSALFPRDVLAEVAEAIKASTSLCSSMLNKVMALPDFSREWRARGVDGDLSHLEKVLGILVLDRAPIAMDEMQDTTAQESLAVMRESFLKDVGLVAVRRFDGGDVAIG